MVVMENKSITKSTITSAFCIACITAIFAVLQMALAYYMYNVLKSDFNEAFLNEIRSGVCKEEIQRILTNPEFPFYKSDMKKYIQSTSYVDFLNARYREDGEKDPDDYSIQPIEVTKVPLETVLEFCKTTVEKCPNRSSPRNIRRRRDMGVPGLTGPQGVKGDKGEVGRSGWDGLPGPKGDQGERGIPGEIQTPTPSPPVKGSSDDYRQTWTATKYGKENYPQLPPRTKRCVLQSIGQPKSNVYISAEYGSWIVDSYPPTNADADKNWVTVTEENDALFEYKKLTAPAEKNYVLKKTVRGNSQAIYKGFFYYQSSEEKPTIVKYCLLSQTTQELQVPGLTAENSKPLYTTSINHLDFSVDENGLWVIFAVPNSNNTGVMKVDPDSLRPQHIWDVSVNHLLFNEMFIASGILYGIDDITTKDKRVSLLIDLYTGKSEKVDIDVDARHGMGSMATYDFLGKKIMTWNMGSLVSYPVTCEESQSK